MQLGSRPPLNAGGFPQHKILYNEFALAPLKWSAASPAGYFAIYCLGTGFNFDGLIERVTIRTVKEFSTGSHHTPHPVTYGEAYIFARSQAMLEQRHTAVISGRQSPAVTQIYP